MSTQNTHTINEINHRVRSGGMYWKQYNILKMNAWYFASEARLSDTSHPKWLITNTNLAKLLNVSANNLASYRSLASDKQAIYHDDAPTHFVSDEIKPTKRTRQLMWTLSGVDFIINKSGIRLGDLNKQNMLSWLTKQSALYGVTSDPVQQDLPITISPKPAPTVKAEPLNKRIKSVADAKQNIIESVHYIIDIIDQLCIERNKRRELEAEVAALRDRLSPAVSKGTPAPAPKPVKQDTKIQNLRKVDNKNQHKYTEGNESLSQYISRKGNKHYRAEQLTRMGLLNSEQIYSLFSDCWTDPITNKLVIKSKFQEIIRQVFHITHSNHRTPMLKSEMIRDNMAIVCQVLCKKKPNPTDDYGNKLELDNPAYISSPEPCVRFQTRYTSKAIDYLRDNWYMLVESSSGQTIKA